MYLVSEYTKTVYRYLAIFLIFCSIASCGETPTSHLSEQFPIIHSGPHDMEFAFIPKGTFRMGSPAGEEDREDNEHLHWVKLTEDYWMQTTEVTIGQWFGVMDNYPDNDCWKEAEVKKEHKYPVVCVSWNEVKEFINSLNKKERDKGYKYSLPTEAQWEYATRAYTETPYSIEGPLKSFAWYKSSSDGHTHPVGALKSNFFGLYDVHGNVFEWVSDWYGDYPRADFFSGAVKNPRGPDDGSHRALRGGSWFFGARSCRSGFRARGSTSSRGNIVGFRLLRTKI